jgi:hypothetical protein
MSCSPDRRLSVSRRARPLSTTVAALCLGVFAAAQTPTAITPDGDAPAAASSQDRRPSDRTLRAVVADAKALDVKTVQGDVTVRRDAAAKGLELTAVVRRAGGKGDNRFDDAEFAACLRGAKLVAGKDDQGKVTARVEFPPAAAADEAAVRRHEQCCDNSFEVAFTVRADDLAGVAASSVTGTLRSEGNLGPVALTTVSGDIEVQDADGPVSAVTVSGDVRIGLAERATGDVTGTTTTGRVELTLSAAWQGTWQAAATMGSVATEGRTGSARCKRATAGFGMRANGAIGDAGAAQAKLTTVTGSIRVVGAAAADDSGKVDGRARDDSARDEAGRDDAAAGDGAGIEWVSHIRAEVAAAIAEAKEAAAAAVDEARAAMATLQAEFGEHGVPSRGSQGFGELPGAAEIEATVRAALDSTRQALAAVGAATAAARAAAKAVAADIAATRAEPARPSSGSAVDSRRWTIQIDGAGSVRVEVRQRGPDGEFETKVYEAPDMATFRRQHPGVLDGGDEVEDARSGRGKARASRRAK